MQGRGDTADHSPPIPGADGALNWRFVRNGILLSLAGLALVAATLYGLMFPAIPYGPIPQQPTIDQPTRQLPPHTAGLPVWAEYRDRPRALAGSGFFLELPDGQVVGVSAAHSFDLSGGLMAVVFANSGSAEGARLNALYGEPGAARLFGNDLTGDYLLLAVPQGSAAGLTLAPDVRGGPQPGERIVVYSGVLARPQEGSVFRSGPSGAWAIMDQTFEPALTSGSPVFSQHTGQVVGMALVAGSRSGQLVLGMHPIASIVEKGLAATELLPLAELP